METPNLTEATLKEQLERAQARAIFADATEPRACTAYYDRTSSNIVIELKDGATFTVPHQLLQGLAGADSQDLAAITLTPSGGALHWETLDVHLRVPSILQGIYGTKTWMEKIRQPQIIQN
jgi:Protein of unknown function (DUF2442)